MKIAFIGFGEVGQTFAAEFLKFRGVSVSAFDIQFAPNGGLLRDRAEALGVEVVDCPSEGAHGADVVISAVTADQCEAAAVTAADYISAGQFFFDINSASPNTKRRAAAHIEIAGGSYVEGAVMAAVKVPKLQVPILAGGDSAAILATRLNALGMNITPVTTEVGRASATKLCRSIIIKGLEALLCDCSAAATDSGVADEVYRSLSETFPSIDWPSLAISMRERVEKHGIRRAAEMREAADMLDELGYDSRLARAVADRQEIGASVKSTR